MNKIKYTDNKGLILLNTLVFAVIAITVTTALINWAATMIKSTRQLSLREQAFQAAEAGIDYYRWHLAHAPTDFTDGIATTTTGPFIHDLKDKNENIIGQFALTITPPGAGSSVVVVKSKGTIVNNPSISRTIQTTLASPPLTKYSVVANDTMRFSPNTEIFGAMHSNGGIRFDGLAHNTVTSAMTHYNDPDWDDCNTESLAVHTCVGPADPNWTPSVIVPPRPDIFAAGRQFPVPAVDFNGMITNLATIKTAAQTNGRYFAHSGFMGYRIVLKTNDTFDLYRVTAINVANNNCITDSRGATNWGTWSVKSQKLLGNYSFPANGAMFFEDNIWVEGKINTARLNIAAGAFPHTESNFKTITVNNDLLYTNYDGQDSIALVSSWYVNVGLTSEDDLRIDAALVAMTGRVGRFYYSNRCGTGYTRSVITLYGMIVTNGRYGFSYTDGTGYQEKNIIYDSNLLNNPPPYFPLTSDKYVTTSWDEVK